jgi:hypothetical protein
MINDIHKIQIIEFSDELSEPIKTLNYEWLEKYFRVEEGDIISLSNPNSYFILKYHFAIGNSLIQKIRL